MDYDFYCTNPKKKLPRRERYRPYQYKEMTPEYLDKLRHKVRYSQTDCARLLAFVNQLLKDIKGEKSEWTNTGVKRDGKYENRLKYRIKYRNGTYKHGKDLPKRLSRRAGGVRRGGPKVVTPKVLGY